jgi:hypothetical protein
LLFVCFVFLFPARTRLPRMINAPSDQWPGR